MRLPKSFGAWPLVLTLVILGFGCASEPVTVSENLKVVESAEILEAEPTVEINEVSEVEPTVEIAEVVEVETEIEATEVLEVEPTIEAAETTEAEEVVDVTEQAMIEIRFIESAPKDKFVFRNIGSCILSETMATIDLTNSAGKLIFDTTGAGAGVEVFQPFEISEGELELVSSERVSDGDTGLTVRISSFAPGAQVGFTIDVDDTLADSDLGMIRVTDSEMNGGEVIIAANGNDAVSAAFGEGNVIVLSASCA